MDPYATNSFNAALCNLHTASVLVWWNSIKPHKITFNFLFQIITPYYASLCSKQLQGSFVQLSHSFSIGMLEFSKAAYVKSNQY